MEKKSNKKKTPVSKTSTSEVSNGPANINYSKNKLDYLNSRWVLSAIIFVVSFLVYAPSLENDFVWDDVIVIKKQYYNFENTKFSNNIIPKARKNRKASYYRPVIFYSIVMDYKVWGDNPLGYHLTNNLLFSLSSLLFFFLILLILKEFHIGSKEYIAALAALIYIVHPMHVESVSWISGRSDVICTLFFLAAFVFHILCYRSILFLPLTILMLLLSFLSKELAVAFPFLVLGFDLLKSKKIRLKNIYISLIYFVILALYLFVRARGVLNIPDLSTKTIGKSLSESAELIHYFKAFVVMLNTYLFYIIKLVFPFKFNALITEVPKEVYYTVFSIVTLTAISIWAFISIKFKTGLKALCIFWVLITLGPSVLVAIFKVATTPLAERYLFLPICGFSLLISYTVWPYFKRTKTKNTALIVFSILCVVLLFFNIQRQFVWQDRVTFWDDISTKSDNSTVAKINQGMALIEGKKVDEGLKILESVFESENNAPNSIKSIASNNIGIAYLNKQKPQIARKWFLRGVKYNPKFHKSYFHLALIDFSYANRTNSIEQYKKAEENLQKAIKANSRYARAYYLLARIYIAYDQPEQAKEYAQKALNFGLVKPLDEKAQKIVDEN